MDPVVMQLIVGGIVELLLLPLVVFVVKRAISKRLDSFDAKRDMARAEMANDTRRAAEQREAERTIVLAMARTMLLDNYEKCSKKGCYTLDEREVYSKLYQAYKDDSGNGVIDTIAERIRRLPLEPPKADKTTS